MTRLVLLPGMDGTGTLFSDFVRALPPTIQPTIIPYPANIPLDYAGLIAWVLARLPREDTYILVGESFSGPIAIAIAATHPAGLRGVILVCSFAKSPVFSPTILRGLVTLIPFGLLPARFGSILLLGRFASRHWRDRLRTAIRQVAASVWRARLRAVLDVDMTAKLRGILVPVLYLRASDDRIVSAAAATTISRDLREMRIVEIEGPHMLLQVAAAACAAQVDSFARLLDTPTQM